MSTDDKSKNGMRELLKDLRRHFEKMSNAIHQFTEVYRENTHRLPFWKTKSFWSLVVVVTSLSVGFSSLYYTGKDAVSLMQAYNVEKQIERIQEFKAYENKAIVKARMTIINQTIECPVTDVERLKQMKIERNKTLVNITAYNSRLNVKEDNLIVTPIASIVAKIYGLGLSDICKIKPNDYDKKLEGQLLTLNKIINGIIIKRENTLSKLKF